MKNYLFPAMAIALGGLVACRASSSEQIKRDDAAYKLAISLSGSLQNPAFSPDGKSILFTRFRDGYNQGASDLFVYNMSAGKLSKLISDGYNNINLPGSVWNEPTGLITFSSGQETHDEIFVVPATGTATDEIQVTARPNKQAFEPSFSPDGKWVVFESHAIDSEKGIITKYAVDGSSGYITLTESSTNAKQPNWSPSGEKILYQSQDNGHWDIWTMDSNGSRKTRISNFPGSKSDAVFSSDGKSIIFSMENDSIKQANIFRVSLDDQTLSRLTRYDGYDGAPSISPDGTRIAFESSTGDPDESHGTHLWVLKSEE